MSTSFSANQYESAFKSQKLQNWTIPKRFKERPAAAEGHTTFIATDRGHLLPGVRSKNGSAWPSFQGTWDLPQHIPSVYINPTARSREGQDRLRTWGMTISATSQTPKAGGSRATRCSQNEENINVNQLAEESKMPVSNPDQVESELITERPKSQNNQAQSRPASQSGQPAPSEPANHQKNQSQSRPESQQSHPAQSRPGSQHSQIRTSSPVQHTNMTADKTPVHK